MHWDKSRLSQQLTRMAQRALIEREPCKSDNRGAFVVLTAQGHAAIAQAAPRHVAHVRQTLIDALTPQQLDVLAQVGDIVRGAPGRVRRCSGGLACTGGRRRGGVDAVRPEGAAFGANDPRVQGTRRAGGYARPGRC